MPRRRRGILFSNSQIYEIIIFMKNIWMIKKEKVDTTLWYLNLKKPTWAPPASIFGPVWAFLYLIIFVTYAEVVALSFEGRIPFLVELPFILNILFNLNFSAIQFRLKNNFLAMIDILFILGTLIWAMIAIFPFAPFVAYANIPYLLWVLFATVLQITITNLNKGAARKLPVQEKQ